MSLFAKKKLKEIFYNLLICLLGLSIYYGWANTAKIIVSFLITSLIYAVCQFIGMIKPN